jgi:hypothetical protein
MASDDEDFEDFTFAAPRTILPSELKKSELEVALEGNPQIQNDEFNADAILSDQTLTLPKENLSVVSTGTVDMDQDNPLDLQEGCSPELKQDASNEVQVKTTPIKDDAFIDDDDDDFITSNSFAQANLQSSIIDSFTKDVSMEDRLAQEGRGKASAETNDDDTECLMSNAPQTPSQVNKPSLSTENNFDSSEEPVFAFEQKNLTISDQGVVFSVSSDHKAAVNPLLSEESSQTTELSRKDCLETAVEENRFYSLEVFASANAELCDNDVGDVGDALDDIAGEVDKIVNADVRSHFVVAHQDSQSTSGIDDSIDKIKFQDGVIRRHSESHDDAGEDNFGTLGDSPVAAVAEQIGEAEVAVSVELTSNQTNDGHRFNACGSMDPAPSSSKQVHGDSEHILDDDDFDTFESGNISPRQDLSEAVVESRHSNQAQHGDSEDDDDDEDFGDFGSPNAAQSYAEPSQIQTVAEQIGEAEVAVSVELTSNQTNDGHRFNACGGMDPAPSSSKQVHGDSEHILEQNDDDDDFDTFESENISPRQDLSEAVVESRHSNQAQHDDSEDDDDDEDFGDFGSPNAAQSYAEPSQIQTLPPIQVKSDIDSRIGDNFHAAASAMTTASSEPVVSFQQDDGEDDWGSFDSPNSAEPSQGKSDGDFKSADNAPSVSTIAKSSTEPVVSSDQLNNEAEDEDDWGSFDSSSKTSTLPSQFSTAQTVGLPPRFIVISKYCNTI